LLFLSFIVSHTMMYLTALERLMSLKGDGVQQEGEWHNPSDTELISPEWPVDGVISFTNVTLRYRAELPPAIKDLTLHVRRHEKLGIVGRTGAGKSSLAVLLFRLREAEAGEICIDGVNIARLGLMSLRKRLAVIPQEPLLIKGTVRDNLDPFHTSADADLRSVLKRVCLHEGLGLDRDALTLSIGERQLLTIARVLLRNVSVILLDEPTSRVDEATDAALQVVIKDHLMHATVFTIAHRINTVISHDRIAVMSSGELLEIGTPEELLINPQSELSQLTASLGSEVNLELRRQARNQGDPSLWSRGCMCAT